KRISSRSSSTGRLWIGAVSLAACAISSFRLGHLKQVLGDSDRLAAAPQVAGERLVHVRHAAVAPLTQRRNLERLTLQHGVTAELVAGASPEAPLAAELRIELRIGLAVEHRRRDALQHQEAAGAFAAVLEPDVVQQHVVVGIGDDSEPAPVGHSLPVPYAPGMVTQAVA